MVLDWGLNPGPVALDSKHSTTRLSSRRCVSVKLKLLLLEISEIVCSVNLDFGEEDVCTHLNMDCIPAGKPFCNLKYIYKQNMSITTIKNK